MLLVVSGSVAAYKALELARLLRKAGHGVSGLLTSSGARFVTPHALAAITGGRVWGDLWSLEEETEAGHIRLAREHDLVVVAPASASRLAAMALGLADDLAGAVLLATTRPVLVAPAMNPTMWLHPATQAHVATLRARGVRFVGPEDGAMAEPESGPGRLSEPPAILAAIEAMASGSGRLAGRRALVTSGPTQEPIDPVRYLSNHSSGRQGHAIAAALAEAGAEVVLVSGPVAIAPPPGVRTVRVTSAREMLAACEAALPVDVAVLAAAVADWRPETMATRKLKKGDGADPALTLVRNPDILAGLSAAGPRRPRLVVGFAAETDAVLHHAAAKLERKGCDWIVANDVSGDVMGGAENQVHLVTREGQEEWPRMDKSAVARRLVERIADALVS